LQVVCGCEGPPARLVVVVFVKGQYSTVTQSDLISTVALARCVEAGQKKRTV
jgi:hypothetical protein